MSDDFLGNSVSMRWRSALDPVLASVCESRVSTTDRIPKRTGRKVNPGNLAFASSQLMGADVVDVGDLAVVEFEANPSSVELYLQRA